MNSRVKAARSITRGYPSTDSACSVSTLLAVLVTSAAFAAVLAPSGGAAAGREQTEGEARMELLWTRYGTGYVTDIAAGDVDGDGQNEPVVGGRGLGVIGLESVTDGRFRWVNKWLDPEGLPLAGDEESVTEFVLEDLTGDGALDAIVGSDEGLFAIDGRSGKTLWVAIDESTGTAKGAWEVAIGDFNGDGTPDAVFAELLDERISAVDGRDGSLLWIYPRPMGFVMDLAAEDLNGDGFVDVVAVGHANEVFTDAGRAEAGIEVHAISGGAASGTGVAAPLWVQSFPAFPSLDEGGPGSVAIAQVEPGLFPEVVVGGRGALAVLDGLTGATRAQRTSSEESIGNVIPIQLDDDEQLEVVTSVVSSGAPAVNSVAAFDSDLTPMWSLEVPAPIGEIAVADLDQDGRAEIIAGGGFQRLGGVEEEDGFALAIEAAGADAAIEWLTRLPEDVDSLAVGDVFGENTVLAGQRGALGLGGGVYGLDRSGEVRWFFRSGGRVEAVLVSDIDGDAVSEVVEGSEGSHVTLHDEKGRLLWHARVPGKGGPTVQAVAAGDLTPHAGKEIAAGTWEFDRDAADGRVHLYSAGGQRLWTRDIAGTVGAVAIEDIDGDGEREVLVAAAAKGIAGVNGVAGRYDAAGNVVWETTVPTGQRTSLSLADVNADGVKDLVLTRASVFHGGAVFAVDGASGEKLWNFDRPGSVNWASVADGATQGITAGDQAGNVFRLRTHDGSEVWRVDPGSVSWDGEWSIDVDGDGERDVLSASHEGRVRMLAGVDGTVLWESDTEGNPGFKVATLLGGERSFVAVGELGQGPYSAANLVALDARTGARVGAAATHGPVLDLAPGNLDEDPEDEFVAAAGWQLVAVDAKGLIDPKPGPTGSPTPLPTPSPTESPRPGTTSVTFTERSATSGQFSDRASFEARLTDSSGDPIRGAELDFELTGDDSSRTFAATTKGNGVASVTPILNEEPGPHQLTVRYDGDAIYGSSADTTSVVVEREDSTLELAVQGKNNTLRARLSDQDKGSNRIPGRTIDFYGDGEFLGSAVTDENGDAVLEPPPRYRDGSHDFEARFEGDIYYRPSSDQTPDKSYERKAPLR